MIPRFTWQLLPAEPERAASLASSCGVDEAVAQLLLHRGVFDTADAGRFLSPRLSSMAGARAIPGMERAVERLRRAVAHGERLFIFGDSDVDGTTAAALLYQAVTALGGKAVVRIARRIDEGYGFPSSMIPSLVKSGVKLAVLLDCGTNQRDEIDALASKGIETVVLDHHVPGEQMAAPAAHVNCYLDPAYRERPCTAGLAWHAMHLLCAGRPELVESGLELAALGTLADYAPLVGLNRILVIEGLARLAQTRRPGLRAVCESVGLSEPTPDQVLRKLVPRLNAAGRIGDGQPVFELLMAGSTDRAEQLAQQLAACHDESRALHRRILAEAHELVNRTHFKDQYVVVVGRTGWHPGVMGPVAAQLADRFGRPAIAIALDGEFGVGSGRSASAFNLFEALQSCGGTLVRYGGHPQACGLTIGVNDLDRFRDQINQHAKRAWQQPTLDRTLRIDLELPFARLTDLLVAAVDKMRPFGPGNPKPLMLVRDVAVEADARDRMWIGDGARRIRIRSGSDGLMSGGRYDVVVTPSVVDGTPVLAMSDGRTS